MKKELKQIVEASKQKTLFADNVNLQHQQLITEVWEIFNTYIFIPVFENVYKMPFIIYDRKQAKAAAHFWPEKWKINNSIFHEISLNPDFLHRKPLIFLSSFLHEAIHLIHFESFSDTFPKNGYHNKAFFDLMFKVGLICSSTGEPGGKPTGKNMSHYIDEEGIYFRVFNTHLSKLPFDLVSKIEIIFPKDAKKANNKQTYICPECNLKCYGAKDLKLICATCDHSLINQAAEEDFEMG